MQSLLVLSLALSLLPSQVAAGISQRFPISEAPSLFSLFPKADVVVIGETHRKPASTTLITQTVTQHLHQGHCLGVALEISSDQQEVLEAALQGRAPISAIDIFRVIDHSGLRRMLTSFRDHVQADDCLTVHAIDAPWGAPRDRDAWMAQRISTIQNQGPVLALVGSIHALKEVHWYGGLSRDMLGERLQEQHEQVVSVLQDWPWEFCQPRTGQLMSTQHPQSGKAISRIIKPLAAHLPKDPMEVADAVIVWECADAKPGTTRQQP